jgi:hypothetical protein
MYRTSSHLQTYLLQCDKPTKGLGEILSNQYVIFLFLHDEGTQISNICLTLLILNNAQHQQKMNQTKLKPVACPGFPLEIPGR